MCWGWRTSKPSVLSGSIALPPVAATGGRLCLIRCASTMSHSTWSSATGSVAKKIALYSQVHLPFVSRKWPALVDAADAVHDLQDELLADDRVLTHLGNELVADVGERRTVRASHVVDRAVAHVLQGAGHAGRAVVLQHRNGHDLVDGLGDQFAEMRAVLAIVLGVGAVLDQIHPDERVVVEARDRIVRKRGKIERELVAFGVQPAPPDAGGQDLV